MIMQKKSNMLLILVAAMAMAVAMLAAMSVTAYAATDTYTSLIPTKDDDEDTVAAKVVQFNGYSWYIIEDKSTAADEGTVTLFAKEMISRREYGVNCHYLNSGVKKYLDSLTEEEGDFAKVADAIVPTDLPDVYVTGAKLYLLSYYEVTKLNSALLKCAASDWWVRIETVEGVKPDQIRVIKGNGMDARPEIIRYTNVGDLCAVRPALRLDLSKVSFSLESKEFTLKNVQHLAPLAEEIASEKIKALPARITLSDAADVNAAVEAYLALSKAQRKFIVLELEQKLAKAEDAIITAKAKAKATRIIKVKNQKGRKVVVRWKKTPNVIGYQVRYSTSKNFRKNVVTKKTKKSATKITLTNLKKFEVINVEAIPYTKVTNRITKKSKVVLGKAQNTKKVKIVK